MRVLSHFAAKTRLIRAKIAQKNIKTRILGDTQ
jgi:hypothetical protein